ncbi:Phage-related baseplate assembly protein [Loktanella atrilutea]|uniref:Phage-related baseplate assembly protein n=1 Tax=Loktanella atrilutea TaxID=366533 RepID=A0A1M4WDH6_LOKAT|nr:baseplate J/gp47 family protein [Loktanella atrilutea]SHE79237.1 Phage-related baseplate assembly protein [Loktanella atrilutea]
MTVAIDLSRVPLPDLIQTLSFEAILVDIKAYANLVYPFIDLESDPVVMLMEAFAYRELLLRARINDAGRGAFIATASGADLDNLAALFGVVRLVLSPADLTVTPVVDAVYESDTALRYRAQLALEGFSTAGPRDAYRFHALSVDARIISLTVTSPSPGSVLVTYYAADANGDQVTDLTDKIFDALSGENVRPLCDTVIVQPAAIVAYDITATLETGTGPDAEIVRQASQDAATKYAASRRVIGEPVPLSGIYAALHQPGVDSVALIEPSAEVAVMDGEVGVVGAIVVTVAP